MDDPAKFPPGKFSKATEKFIVLIFYNKLEDNQFASCVTDELGRSGKSASFEEIHRLYQYTQV